MTRYMVTALWIGGVVSLFGGGWFTLGGMAAIIAALMITKGE